MVTLLTVMMKKNGKFKRIQIQCSLFTVCCDKSKKIRCFFFFSRSGENLDGAELSFTTHKESCQWERKDTVYRLTVKAAAAAAAPQGHMSERAFVTFNLPYYNSTLYLCLSPKGSHEAFHQGNRYSNSNDFQVFCLNSK